MTDKIRHLQVVVAYDFSATAEEALVRAADVACRAPQHILHVITVIDPHRGASIEPTQKVDYAYAERIQEKVKERLTAAFAGRDAASEVHFFVYGRIGKPAEEVLGLAKEIGADLLFIGSHGRKGIERLLLGSVSERVVREAQCAVMVCRHKTYVDVELEPVVAVTEEHHHYVRPHRYSYKDRRVETRPNDWPIS